MHKCPLSLHSLPIQFMPISHLGVKTMVLPATCSRRQGSISSHIVSVESLPIWNVFQHLYGLSMSNLLETRHNDTVDAHRTFPCTSVPIPTTRIKYEHGTWPPRRLGKYDVPMIFPWFSGWNDGSGMGSPASIGHALASHNHLQSLKLLTQRFCSNRWAWWTSSALSLYMHIYYIYACAPVYICGEILHIYLSTYKSIYLSTYLSIYL